MPQFRYSARNLEGTVTTGVLESDSTEAVKVALRQRGLYVTRVKAVDTLMTRLSKPLVERVKPLELVMYTKQIAVLLEAGVSLTAALDTMQEMASPRFQPILRRVIEDIKSGKTYSMALSRYPHIFSPFFIGMMEVGEASGLLGTMHAKVSSHLEQAIELRKKLLYASLYPGMVFLSTILGICIILVYAFPKIADMYSKNKVPLPWLTQAMINISSFLTNQWYIPLAVGLGVLYLFLGFRIHHRQPFKSWFDGLALRLPFYNSFYRQVILARITHNLALLLNSGITILKALEIIKTLMDNGVIQVYLDDIIRSVREGKGLTAPLRQNRFFPKMLISMVRTGEESGALSEMMMKAGAYYGQEVEDGVKTLTTLMEPMLIVFAAGAVFLVLLAFYLPMFQMIRVMSRQ